MVVWYGAPMNAESPVWLAVLVTVFAVAVGVVAVAV